jgi:hypothetical protein
MGAHLVRWDTCEGDPGRLPIRYASVNGRQFFSIASSWPELQDKTRLTGVYQALGREKMQTMAQGQQVLEDNDGSFDAFRPTALIYEYLPLGPLVQMAITFGCGGPFLSLEGDALAGPMAVVAALDDLEAGRCDQAIVGEYDHDAPTCRLLLLERVEGPALRRVVRYGAASAEPPAALVAEVEAALGASVALVERGEEPHGLVAMTAALEQAQAGTPSAVWRYTDDGRGMLVGLRAD